jgi:VIT1/CCC1 family predicted Fe2+/Mn2+ transporter
MNMAVDRDRVRRFREMWADEMDAAALYRTLAEASEGRRAEVLMALAEAEERHAAHWAKLLHKAGVTDLGPRRPSMRLRVLGFLARRFGADSVLPLVLRLEAADAAKYRDVAEAPAAMSAEEMSHGRTVAALGGAPTGERIARSEGRHRARTGGALRAAVFGMNDGLLSNLLLVLAVAGGTSNRHILLLAGVGGMVAGAFSMAAGEWVSVQSMRELYERELSVEREELAAFPEEEQEELALIYEAKGIPTAEARALAARIMRQPDSALDTLAREELGLSASDLGSPWVAAGSSFASFAAGALVPVIPFLLGSGTAALVAAVVLSALTLVLVGGAISVFTGRSAGRGSLRMLGIATLVGAVSYLVGRLVGASV